MRRLRVTALAIWLNWSRGWRMTSGIKSFLRWAVDTLLYRIMAVIPIAGVRVRTIRLRGGCVLSYRLSRADFRTVAETWLTGFYELPFAIEPPRLVVDLGANIGATATWLVMRYGCDRLIAVEPVPANAALARRNLAANGVNAEVHEAAVGAREGTAYFDDSGESTEGRLADRGREVRVLTVPELIGREQVDLMKMDIEGAEAEVIAGEPGWLRQVRVLITELHPQFADTDRILETLKHAGFEYRRLPGDPHTPDGPEFMAVFSRPEPGGSSG